MEVRGLNIFLRKRKIGGRKASYWILFAIVLGVGWRYRPTNQKIVCSGGSNSPNLPFNKVYLRYCVSCILSFWNFATACTFPNPYALLPSTWTSNITKWNKVKNRCRLCQSLIQSLLFKALKENWLCLMGYKSFLYDMFMFRSYLYKKLELINLFDMSIVWHLVPCQAQLVQLWPNGDMDNHGIKHAIFRAKERRKALYSRHKVCLL